MQTGQGNISMKKHGKGGHSANLSHFTGPTKGKPVRRKSREKKKHVHKNKYEHFSKVESKQRY
ncbi:MAG: hypothetical protein WCW87_01090 [Candidatus Paceibacterota bacterium]